MKRLSASMALTAALVVLLALVPAAGARSRPAAPDPNKRLAQAAGRLTQASASATAAAARQRGFRLVGHSTVGGGGFNADVWAHRGYAYLGVWGAGPEHCPASGVKVVDVRHPSQPRLVARLANPAGTTAEDVVVRSVRTKAFRGDLAVTGIQACDPDTGVFRGLSFWESPTPASRASWAAGRHLATRSAATRSTWCSAPTGGCWPAAR